MGAFIAALALFALGGRLRRTQAPAGHPALRSAPGSGFGLRYWVVVAAEVVALLTGLMVINAVFRAHELNVPWIAVVVGVHFFGLIPLWDARLHFAVLGVAVTTLGVAGFVLYAAGAPALTLRVVSGIGSGVVLYLAAAHSLLRRSAFGRSPEHGSIDV